MLYLKNKAGILLFFTKFTSTILVAGSISLLDFFNSHLIGVLSRQHSIFPSKFDITDSNPAMATNFTQSIKEKVLSGLQDPQGSPSSFHHWNFISHILCPAVSALTTLASLLFCINT